MDNETQIAVPASESSQMVTMIERMVMNPDVDVDKLERLLALSERTQARNAEREFNEAMRAVQKNAPSIKRNKSNEQTKSNYADLEELNRRLIPIYTSEGFSLSFGTADCPVPDHYRVTCIVSHIGGHSRPYQADIPNDMNGLKGNANKTGTHAFGSSMSYGRRYLTLLIFNITLSNEDNDGNGLGETVSDTQANEIEHLIADYEINRPAFFKWAKVNNVNQILAANYKACITALDASYANKQKRGGWK
jgi:hypothetical protein